MTEPGGEEELLNPSGQNNGEIKNVMILGGGRVGKKVAEDLSAENINVKLVESNKHRAEVLAEDLSDCLIIYGDGTNSELLEEENLGQMDAFIAVTGDSETNIMSSLIAKSKGIKVNERKIAPAELSNFVGCFLTGTAAEVTPVSCIAENKFEVCETIIDLNESYQALVRKRKAA